MGKQMVIVQDYAEFREKFIKAKTVFFDTETTGLEVGWFGKVHLVGITFSFDDNDEVYYLPFRHRKEEPFSFALIMH